MSAFKDAVANDVMSVFLNVDEFADEHTINGKKVMCIVDKDITAGRDGREVNLQGIFLNTLTVYVRSSDFERRPVEGELLYLDNEVFPVRNVSDEMGVLVIGLEVQNQ